MALQASSSNETDENSNSHVPGLHYFRQEADKTPSYEWEQWGQIFEVAVLARHSIFVSELVRDEDQNNPRSAALMENLELEPAKRKMTSLLYISIGKTGKKMLMDKFPKINFLLIQLNILLLNCNECFQMRRNRTLDRHTFLSRKQKPSETLHQFWNVLNGLAAKCDLGNQTEGLVYDIFILNMSNKQVQEKLCTEPKDNPLDALQCAIAFEDGLKRQKTYGYFSQEAKVKEGPLCANSGNRQNNGECWRCGAGNFTLDHVKIFRAADAKCKYCGRKGQLERVCNQRPKDNTQQFAKSRTNGVRYQFNKRVQLVD